MRIASNLRTQTYREVHVTITPRLLLCVAMFGAVVGCGSASSPPTATNRPAPGAATTAGQPADRPKPGGMSVADACRQLTADEEALRVAAGPATETTNQSNLAVLETEFAAMEKVKTSLGNLVAVAPAKAATAQGFAAALDKLQAWQRTEATDPGASTPDPLAVFNKISASESEFRVFCGG